MSQYNIAVLAGDGIGPEVMQEANKVLDAPTRLVVLLSTRKAKPCQPKPCWAVSRPMPFYSALSAAPSGIRCHWNNARNAQRC